MPDNFLEFVNLLFVGGGLGYLISKIVELVKAEGNTKHLIAVIACILAGMLLKMVNDLPPEVIASIEPWYDSVKIVFVAYFGTQLTYHKIIKK